MFQIYVTMATQPSHCLEFALKHLFQNKFQMKEKQTCILTTDTVVDDPHLV